MEVRILSIFFTWMWKKHRKTNCEACGIKLPRAFSTANQDHLLEKQNYPDCMCSKSNIFWCCEECHSLKGKGFAKPKHKAKIDWARENIPLLEEENRIFVEQLNKLLNG